MKIKNKKILKNILFKIETQQPLTKIEFPRGFDTFPVSTSTYWKNNETNIPTYIQLNICIWNLLKKNLNMLIKGVILASIFSLIIYIIFNISQAFVIKFSNFIDDIKKNNETDKYLKNSKLSELNKQIDKFIFEIEEYIKYCVENRRKLMIYFLKYLFFILLRGFFYLLYLFILFLIYIFTIGVVFYIEFDNLIKNLIKNLKKKCGKYFPYFCFLSFLFLSLLILITKLKLMIEAENKMLRDIIY